jgi:tetratricopeptide (TPR) repeat protein
MAIQIWQQILLSDPKNSEALAGLARDYKLSGSVKESDDVLEKLRAINPNDPNIAKIQSLTSSRSQSEDLRRAGDLARQGHNDDAMKIYRQLYNDHPPEGDIALAYYQTMYGTASGKEQAISAMRALAQQNPADSRYSVELGRMLTYDPRSRPEGIRILQEHPLDPNARSALRQALVWDSANPSSSAELRKYLQAHPEDSDLASRLKENESKLAQMNSGIARTPEERAAFAALNARKLDEAQTRFMDLLEKDPNNGRVAAGMGFLRMQQQNFGGAVSYLTQAEQNGYKSATVENALATSRFWYTMGEASQAFDANQLDVAAQKYKDALAMRPKSPEAMNGLAGLYTKQEQYEQAAGVYQDLLKAQPANADAWRGLFLAYARDGQNQKALALAAKFPPRVKSEMAKDPDYLRTLATIYKAEGRPGDAQKVLSQALALPFPDNGANLKEGTRLQYAGILMEAHRFDQAATIYTQILDDDATSLPAWMGLVSAHHELGQDSTAIADVEKMPPAVYESALSDAGFLSMLGSIYQQANQFDIAQSLLERSVKVQLAQGTQPTVPMQMQLAGIYLQRGNTAQAYAIYRQVLTAEPNRVDAWKGLISTL